MDELRRNIWVGVFVLAGFGALGSLILLFGYGPSAFLQRNTYDLLIHFEEASSIRPGNLVTARGVTIGRVAEVDLADRNKLEMGVLVRCAIDRRYQIPAGSAAQTTEQMLGQGRPPIVILPGPSAGGTMDPNMVLEGRVRGGLEGILPAGTGETFKNATDQIGQAATALTPVLEELRELLRQRKPDLVDTGEVQGNFSSAVARLDIALRDWNEVLGDPNVKWQLRDTVANIHSTSLQALDAVDQIAQGAEDGRALIADARGFVDRTRASLDTIDTRVNDVARRANETLDQASTFMTHLNVAAAQISGGEGTVGRLVMDAKLYESMVITADRLTLTLDDLRALLKEWREGGVRIGL